jgi:FkbM family methyltransferase
MFFGQHLEDEFINFIFSNIEKGVCIDVGAYDGINGSNTYFFEQKGWDCLCIEPIPDSFNKCNKVRKRTVKCCISNTDKPDTEFTVFALGHNLSAISSLIPDERLIESHKHLITDTSKISVSVRSLTSLLDEIGFNKTIDFISIDTENTELDVLKGIDFYKYDIKMLVIENNFNEPFCENYLLNCGYIKIKRIAVNDFYIKKYIPQLFNITAFYYIANYHEPSNVTNKLILLYSLFKLNNLKNTFVVSNELFGDTIVHSVKTLHINIEIIIIIYAVHSIYIQFINK